MDTSADRAKIDALVARFFSIFDNRQGARPQLSQFVDCFTDNAAIAQHANGSTRLYTVREFAVPRIELLTRGEWLDFHEWEESFAMQVFPGIATRTSRYRKSGWLGGEAYRGAGTKCFQLVELPIGWRIASLAWVDDEPEAVASTR
jgi:hypothetical protein